MLSFTPQLSVLESKFQWDIGMQCCVIQRKSKETYNK